MQVLILLWVVPSMGSTRPLNAPYFWHMQKGDCAKLALNALLSCPRPQKTKNQLMLVEHFETGASPFPPGLPQHGNEFWFHPPGHRVASEEVAFFMRLHTVNAGFTSKMMNGICLMLHDYKREQCKKNKVNVCQH